MSSIVTQADIDLTRKMDEAKMTAFEEAVAGIASQLSERCGAFNGALSYELLLEGSSSVQHAELACMPHHLSLRFLFPPTISTTSFLQRLTTRLWSHPSATVLQAWM